MLSAVLIQGRKGFTVVELMLVVTVIAILAAIAIPNLLRSRLNANESSTIQNMRAIVSAQTMFNTANGDYSEDMEGLADATPPFIDHDFLQEPLNGYIFEFGAAEHDFVLNANPVEWGKTGIRGFFSDASGVIRFTQGAPADGDSTPL